MDIEQLAGTNLGDDEIEILLGRGGMGVVDMARQVSLNRPVVPKILSPNLTSHGLFAKNAELQYVRHIYGHTERRWKMPFGRNGILSALAAVILLAACNGGGPRVDVIEYFGKTEQEIREMLGEPSWRERDSLTTKAATICYHLDEKPLPPPLREVKFLFSDEGVCFQVLGITTDCDTPEEVLSIIGLGDFEKERASQDELGFSYRMPPFELAQIHKPSSIKRYSNFCLLDRDVRDPK